MARRRSAERDAAFELFIQKKGRIQPKEIAKQLGVPADRVRKWKMLDHWEERRKRRGGAPKGNKNAMGNSGGATKGNNRAETHGAYSTPRMENWSEEQIRKIERLTTEFQTNALDQFKKLCAKQLDLEMRIAALDDSDEDQLYRDRVMIMKMPDGGTMQYDSQSSAFSRRMTLEAELNRVQGRIQKMLDSFKTNEEFQQRLKLERERFEFSKMKALGEFSINENGDVEPEIESDDIEIIDE